MPSGGHGKSRIPPDPNSGRSERKRDAAGWTTLPLEGRGRRKAPVFPLVGMTDFESSLWTVLWKKPQAVMWERLGLTLQVAQYARTFSEAAMSNAPASLKTTVLRMEDSLGISPDGLSRLRWRFATDELAETRSSKRAEPEKPAPVRRLRAAGE